MAKEPAEDRRERDPSRTADVLVIVGTRPEAIKLFPLIRRLKEDSPVRPVVVSTGQHPGIVDGILRAAGCTVDLDLAVGRPGLTLNQLVAGVLTGLEDLLRLRVGPAPATIPGHSDTYPVGCIVHGDTSSAAAAALAAFHLRIPVLHVEAGLRTGSTLSPFPEELNRQLIARIASVHLSPTRGNVENLVREGVAIGRTYVTGNTGIDALMWAADQEVPYGRPELAELERDATTKVVTVTAHRRENWGEGVANIAEAVRRLAVAYRGARFVLPVHPNRAVADVIRASLQDTPNVVLTEPMQYLPFARLLKRSYLAITDSGGIQEEAPALGVPVLVTRETTERGEGVLAGTLELVGTDPDRIVTAASRLLDSQEAHDEVARRTNPYGDGSASERIAAAIATLVLGGGEPPSFGPGFSRSQVLEWAGYRPESALPPRGLVGPEDSWLIEGVVTR
jgi:UDP-N-acetylglucosamine 2-epimerase (non-hydrolysing)